MSRYVITEKWGGAWVATVYADRFEVVDGVNTFYLNNLVIAQTQVSSLVTIAKNPAAP